MDAYWREAGVGVMMREGGCGGVEGLRVLEGNGEIFFFCFVLKKKKEKRNTKEK